MTEIKRNIPITKPYFTEDEEAYIADALASGWVAQGAKVASFEKQVAAHEHVAEGVAATSCTTALHLAMAAAGLGEGMDAIAPAFTFVATENSILQTGAVPVLVDIDRKTFNINISELERIIREDYKKDGDVLVNKMTGNILWGIIPVHEFGLCCEIDKVNAIAKENRLNVIEDAACALGSMYNGHHPGDFGNAACVSFHPRKSITTGEGGMILTNDTALARRLRELRSHGSTIPAEARDKNQGFLLPEMNEAGFNYRMTDVQGALGLAQIKKLDVIIEEKRRLAAIYTKRIQEECPMLIPPVEPERYFHTYQSYVCLLNEECLGITATEEGGELRNALLSALANAGISTRQGTHAVHALGYYKKRFGFQSGDYPEAYACDRLSVALPLYYGLTEEDIDYIIENIKTITKEIVK